MYINVMMRIIWMPILHQDAEEKNKKALRIKRRKEEKKKLNQISIAEWKKV